MVFQVVGFHSFMPSLFYSLTAGPNFGVHLNHPSNYQCGYRGAQFEDPEHQGQCAWLPVICTLQDRHPFLLREIGHAAQFTPDSTKILEERLN